MLKPKTKWELAAVEEAAAEKLQRTLHISPLLARLLNTRGINEPDQARKFLQSDLAHCHDPFLMDGMEESVKRIREAVEKGEPILIYGDYDADGVSSTSLLIHTLKRLGATFDYYIPNRFTEGYGLNKPALLEAKERGFSLVITVDTGISAVEEAAFARQLNLDLIITDHHEPPDQLPEAFAVINPKKPGCSYPFKYLAGVGVTFKLAHALLGNMPVDLLELVAVGTIADLVPLIDENRVLARFGLEALSRTDFPGLRALIDGCGLQGKELTADHVGFVMGPRINASGRLYTADEAVQLLTCEDREEAAALAQQLDQYNRERQTLVQKIAGQAIAQVEQQLDPQTERSVLVVADEEWHEGVIGIVASRLVETYRAPAIVFHIDRESGMAKGSARSIEGFDIYRALSGMKELLPHFGGHPMAAGMSIKAEDIVILRERLNQWAREHVRKEDMIPTRHVDVTCRLEELTVETIAEMQLLAPFGEGNPSPVVLVDGVRMTGLRKIGKDENHIKCTLTRHHQKLDAVGFDMADIADHISPHALVELVGEPAINEWNGFRKPQLIIRDVGVSHIQVFDWRGSKEKQKKLEQIAREMMGACAVVCFDERSRRRLEPSIFKGREHFSFCYVDRTGILHSLSHTKEKPAAKEQNSLNWHTLILYDLPEHPSTLERLLRAVSGQIERIYCLFGEEDADNDMPHGLPRREHFKKVYSFLHQRKTVYLPQILSELKGKSNTKGYTPGAIRFILDVFEELGFVHRKEESYHLADNPQKRDLTQSRLYREKEVQIRFQTECLYSSHTSLADWIINMIQSDYQVEEETIHEL